MSYAAEFDALVARVVSLCTGGERPTLFLSWDAGRGHILASGARLLSAQEASAVCARAYAEDPLFVDGGKGLRRMRAAQVVSECRRLGVPHLRPGSKKRARPKRELVADLLGRLQENMAGEGN